MSRLLWVLLCCLSAASALAAEVEVVLQGLSPRGGRILAFLFDDPV